MKYVRPYFLFSLISCIVAILFSRVFRFSLTNTWQAGVAIVFIFGPFLVLGWKFSNKQKDKYPLLCNIIRLGIVLLVFSFILATFIVLF